MTGGSEPRDPTPIRRDSRDGRDPAACLDGRPHARVQELGAPQVVGTGQERRLVKLGKCLACGAIVERVTPTLQFGPWQTLARDRFGGYGSDRRTGS